MKTKIQTIILVLALTSTSLAQSINVTPTGVGIGTTTPATPLHVQTAGVFASTLTGTSTGPSGVMALRNSNSATGWNFGIETGTGWASGPAGAFYIAQHGVGPRLTIAPSGNVGIGTTTPAVKLDIAQNGALKIGQAYLSSGGDYAHLANNEWYDGSAWRTSNTPGALLQLTGQDVNFYTHDGNGLHAARLSIKGNGNVGIGTVSPTEKLEVKGNLKVNDAVLSATGAAPIYGCRAWVNFDGTRNASGVVDSNNTARYIRASGNVSSVIKIGTGSYDVNFATPMPDANYAFTVCAHIWGVQGQSYLSVLGFDFKSTTSIRFSSGGDFPGGGRNDKNEVSVTIIR